MRLNRKSREYRKKETATRVAVYFRRKEQPSVRRALPPVGWHRTVVQPWQITTVWACEKTVVMVKQPGHLTSMKNERGAGTRVWQIFVRYCRRLGRLVFYRTLSLCFRASAAGEGFRRSTARTWTEFHQHLIPNIDIDHSRW